MGYVKISLVIESDVHLVIVLMVNAQILTHVQD